MKRLYILLILLILVGVGAFWSMRQQNNIVPAETIRSWKDRDEVSSGSNTLLGSGADLASGLVKTWTVDDTELPLDQWSENGVWTWDQATDPEVEEVINLLEELIAESEQK